MSECRPGLVDALFEIGKERQEILKKLRVAYETNDLGAVLENVEKIIGLDKKLEGPSEKGH